MFVSAELDDKPPFSRTERRLMQQFLQNTEFVKCRRPLQDDADFSQAKERLILLCARAALTAYHDLRALSLTELMDDGTEYPPVSVGELFGILDETSYQRRYGNDGGAAHG